MFERGSTDPKDSDLLDIIDNTHAIGEEKATARAEHFARKATETHVGNAAAPYLGEAVIIQGEKLVFKRYKE